jgi:GNAT superfamily N-acetyltransferase
MRDDPITVRPARPEDAEAISALITGLTHYGLADPSRPQDAPNFLASISPAGVAAAMADARYRYHVAEHEGQIVGVVAMRDETHLYHLFVAEAFHGRWIAGRLWEVARHSVRFPEGPVRFTVNSSRYAVPVYERLGFVAADTEQVKEGVAFVPMVMAERGDSDAEREPASPEEEAVYDLEYWIYAEGDELLHLTDLTPRILRPIRTRSSPVLGWGTHRIAVEGAEIVFSEEGRAVQVFFDHVQGMTPARAKALIEEIRENIERETGQKTVLYGG